MSDTDRNESLSRALRLGAARAAETVGGGCALLFSEADEGDVGTPRLRAAGGFASPDEARAAAAAVMAAVEQSLRSGEPARGTPPPALGPRAAAGLWVLPLAHDGRCHGALVAGAPSEPSDGVEERLAEIAGTCALHLDHARLHQEVARLRSGALAGGGEGGDQGDELLKLSEALFAQDIELLRSNEKLGKIEKLKNDFIEKMSRELRTPLNSIIEAIISVLAGENEALSDGAKESLRGALDEGTAFQRTLQNILDLWRIKQNELPVEIQEVNVAEVVEEAIFSVQDALGDKPVTIEKDFPEALPKVKTDLAKTNQVFFLLLDNAAKFTHEGRITIRAEVHDESLVCEIQDTGIGVCPDDQDFIFDEFFQVDEHSDTRYRGAGLGLTLVRDLLVLMGGEAELRSEPGQGTTFRFTLPVQRA